MSRNSEVNDRIITEHAQRVSAVLTAAYGVMAGWTPERVAQEIHIAVAALRAYPDKDQTYGLVSLMRDPMTSAGYTIRINLGFMPYFPEEEK
jgi:hypothetical protein